MAACSLMQDGGGGVTGGWLIVPSTRRFTLMVLVIVSIICVLPLALMAFGLDLSSGGSGLSKSEMLGLAPQELVDVAHRALQGSFMHTLLEWTAVCAAAFVGVLAFVQYRLSRESSLLVIGTALLCAGGMDAFHTLAADRLIEASAAGADVGPLTWAVSRFFNGTIQFVGVGALLIFTGRHTRISGFCITVCVMLAVLALVIVQMAASAATLPQAIFPDGAVKRPYDLLPLVPFLLCAFVVFPIYARRSPTFFSAALVLSMIPQIATQLYMAFGSVALYDSAFNVAHGLESVCYLVPMTGLLRQHIFTHVEYRRSEARMRDYFEALEEGNEALEEATCMAEAAAKTKAEFLANMSHEIRTPMTAILGYADILATALEQTENQEAIEIIQRNGQHLLALINDILDISKLDAGRMTVEQIECSPAQLLADVEALLRVKSEAKGLTFRVEQRGAVPRAIVSDPTRLRQVLLNLAGNAIKFTEIGEVCVSARLVSEERDGAAFLQLSVRDTGIGMTDDQLACVFEPFQQADTSTKRNHGGTGLGLSISMRLIELLGGTIHAESTAGEGSTFTVRVPVGMAESEMDLVDELVSQTTAPSTADTDEPEQTDGTLEARVLLVEDGPDNQRLISFHLKKAGALVDLAENGRIGVDQALEQWRAGTPYDVILMDMQMPVMGGYEATGLLRDEGYEGPVIALTAHAMAGDRERCLEAGCNDYTTKPIDRAALIDMIRRCTRDTVEADQS